PQRRPLSVKRCAESPHPECATRRAKQGCRPQRSRPPTMARSGRSPRCVQPTGVIQASPASRSSCSSRLLLARVGKDCFLDKDPESGTLTHRIALAVVLPFATVALSREAPPARLGQGTRGHTVGVGLYRARDLFIRRKRLRRYRIVMFDLDQ